MNMQINRPGQIGADASRLLVHTPEYRYLRCLTLCFQGVDADSLLNMKAGLGGDQSEAAVVLCENCMCFSSTQCDVTVGMRAT